MENSTYVSRRLLHLLFFVLLGVSSQAQQIAKGLTAGNGKYIGFYEYKPTDYKPSGEKYPLIIFLHGVSERGNGTTELSKVLAQAIPRYINKGHKMTFTWNGKKETFLVLSPQLSLSYGNWQQFYTEEMLKYAKENLNIDTNRIYLTGISLGGGGVWNYASASEANSRKFAAIAPICGTCSMSNGCNIAKANVPVWTEHAANDPTVSVNCTINANKAINACTPGVKPIEFIPPTGGHVIWNRSYDTAYAYHQPLIYEWFLGQNKSLPINKLPVAKATAPLEVNISTGTFTLSATGSTDADGTIARYGWRQISGPVTTSVQSAGSASTNVTGLTTAGTYTYELTVIDNRATWDKDTITVKGVSGPVIVPNKAPTANAGADQTITLPTNSVTLNGGASTDADGTITTWAWTKISGPASGTFSNSAAASTTFTGLTEGTYAIQLKITDNDGAADLDTINVIVNPAPNKAPTANAGVDQTITLPTNSVTLNGGASTDADGTITTWAWTKISGPASGSFSNAAAASTSFTGLTEGTYSIQLKITDNDGATDLDTINVIVNPAPNKAPTANAGADQTITLPTNSVTLNGGASTDADGTITTWAWTKISGPASGSFSNAAAASTSFTGLTEGTYSIQLKITDNDGAADLDTIKVIVNPAPNKAPTANAGADQTITLPANSATLKGGASTDADGTIATWAWTKISGPASGAFSNASAASTSFTGLTEGTYAIQLKITDNDGDTDLDTLQIEVKPEPIVIIPNKAPTANAGADQTITLPTNSVTLNGGASTDADGTIATWAWTKISGPAAGTYSNATAASTSFTGLTEGTYEVQLKITDNDGAIGMDTLQIEVKPEPIVIVLNKAPTANAGVDQTITLPTNSVTLNGGASTDADGTITTWAWTKISGPASGTFSNSGAVSTSFTGLTEGTYEVELRITDNDGATDLDTINVIVKPEPIVIIPNKAPTANAGADQTITLPTNSVTLNGGASTDVDGTITTWAWTKISGPAAGIFSKQNGVSTSFTGLIEGTYEVELRITDNDGASDMDTINVIVKPEPIIIIPNKAPTANAGADQTITLPANSVTLNGDASTDADGTITTWAWTKISGPASGTFSKQNGVSTNFTGLTEGTYEVELRITDNDGASDLDTINVIVKPEPIIIIPNKAPNANAGADQTITLPSNSVTLNGGASTDSDGTITTWAWTKISGPASGTFSKQNGVSTSFSGLTEGTYEVELRITDNDGATDLDTIKVIVKPEPIVIIPNNAPTANAGADQTITLPANSVTLNGGASNDADGTITTWAWTKISGPASGTFSKQNGVSTAFTGLTEGTYEVQLKITDNDGAIAMDTLQIEVKPEPIIIIPNKAPTANAGVDQTITLPTNSVTLNGGASTDADGTITTWAWTKISGPASGTFSKQNGVSTSFTGLTEGTYKVELRITDNDGASDLDTINVIVKPEPIIIIPNKAPTANAGADQTITLPSNSVTLNGGASTDADGTITTWAWTKISGPASGTFSKQNGVSTSFTGLTEGTYSIQLKITDNDGASDLDTMKIIVKPAPNKAPIANAGSDKTILTSTESVQLDAGLSNDPDGSISSYNWTRINGTGTMTMTTPNNVTAMVYGLSEGIHVFRVTIKDNLGAQATDEITITVKQPENQKPVAQAGQDITIYVPESKALLDGKASLDPDGLIVRYNWKQLSGPRTAIQSSPASAENEVSELAPGSYSFELTVTDNRNGVSKDTMNLTVVNNFRYEEKLVASPNPAVNSFKLTIYSDSNGAGIITIRDAYGRIMKQIKRDKSQPIEEENIYINDLKSGLYYLDYTIQKSKRMVTRFIKH